MATQDSNLRSLLSPARSGTFFAPFRSRISNPDGFDSKMKLWINAIEEWAIINKKLTVSLKDIHQIFVSEAGIRPDKECIRLVFSEMKRNSKLIPKNNLRNFKSSSTVTSTLDSYIDTKSWFGWGVKKLVIEPAGWALSTITSSDQPCYSDQTDLSITDTTRFVCQRSLHEMAHNLLYELVRISKAEKQVCFEWKHLLELINPIVNTIIDTTDEKELDLLVEYLSSNKHVSVQIDNDTKLIKIAQTSDDDDYDVTITKKDIAMARLLRAKELLTTDADRYHDQAQRARQQALECYGKGELAKAKSLLRSHKRLTNCAEQKESQLNNVETMLEQLENTNSNMMILQAYKDGAEALKIANTDLEANTTVLDDAYDATAEARFLNDEMNRMLQDITCVSQGGQNISNTELEAELEQYIADGKTRESIPDSKLLKDNTESVEGTSVDDLEKRLDNLVVCQDPVRPEVQPKHTNNPAQVLNTAR